MQWIVWADCPNAGGICLVTSFYPNGRAPTPVNKVGDAYTMRRYVTFVTSEHHFVLKLTQCCSPECCGHLCHYEHSDQYGDKSSYTDEVIRHLGCCMPKFEEGFGMLNCMESDIGRPHRPGKPFEIDFSTEALSDKKRHLVDDTPLKEYKKLYAAHRGLQSVRFKNRTSIEHYLSIRTNALTNSGVNLKGTAQASRRIQTEFAALQAQYGRGSTHAAQAGFNWDSALAIINMLYTLGGKDGRGMSNKKRKPPSPIAPYPDVAQHRASANRETFIEVESAIQSLTRRVVAVGEPGFDAFMAEISVLEVEVKSGNRLEGDKNLLADLLQEVLTLMVPPAAPPTALSWTPAPMVPQGGQYPNPNPAPQPPTQYSYANLVPRGPPGQPPQVGGMGSGYTYPGHGMGGSSVFNNPAAQGMSQILPSTGQRVYGTVHAQAPGQAYQNVVPPPPMPTEQSSYLSREQAAVQYRSILREIQTMDALCAGVSTVEQGRQAVIERVNALREVEKGIADTDRQIERLEGDAFTLREETDRIMKQLWKDAHQKAEMVRGDPARAPAQQPGYGSIQGSYPAPAYPPPPSGFGGRGNHPYGGGLGGGPTGSAEELSEERSSEKGAAKPSKKSSKPAPPHEGESLSLPTRPKPSSLQAPGAGSSGNTSTQGDTESVNSNMTKSSVRSKVPGGSAPVSSLQGIPAKKNGGKHQAQRVIKEVVKSPLKSPWKDKVMKK